MTHAAGTTQSPTYLVNFGLPNRLLISGVLVSEFTSSAGQFEAIVGMDVITSGDLSLTHVGGKSCMSFRIPSIAENDFVRESNRRLFLGVGRNDPCPCGAKRDGRPLKYKHCHDGKVEL